MAGFARFSTGSGSKEVDACVKRRRFKKEEISMSTKMVAKLEKQKEHWNYLQVVVKSQEQRRAIEYMDHDEISKIVTETTPEIPIRKSQKRKSFPQ